MKNPLITIIMPAYNAGKYIGKRAREIAEGVPCPGILDPDDIEVVIVNDGSTDGTFAAMLKAGDVFMEHGIGSYSGCGLEDNAGTFYAEEAGLRHATGEYVFFQDADDPFHPALLHELLTLRLTIPSSVHIAAPTRLVEKDGTLTGEIWHSEQGPILKALEKQCKIGRGIITRRSLFRRTVMLNAYEELGSIFKNAGVGHINAVQDSIVITYLFGTGIFKSITESKKAYWYSLTNPESMSHDMAHRKHDIPVLMALTVYAINQLNGFDTIKNLIDDLTLIQKERKMP